MASEKLIMARSFLNHTTLKPLQSHSGIQAGVAVQTNAITTTMDRKTCTISASDRVYR